MPTSSAAGRPSMCSNAAFTCRIALSAPTMHIPIGAPLKGDAETLFAPEESLVRGIERLPGHLLLLPARDAEAELTGDARRQRHAEDRASERDGRDVAERGTARPLHVPEPERGLRSEPEHQRELDAPAPREEERRHQHEDRHHERHDVERRVGAARGDGPDDAEEADRRDPDPHE